MLKKGDADADADAEDDNNDNEDKGIEQEYDQHGSDHLKPDAMKMILKEGE